MAALIVLSMWPFALLFLLIQADRGWCVPFGGDGRPKFLRNSIGGWGSSLKTAIY